MFMKFEMLKRCSIYHIAIFFIFILTLLSIYSYKERMLFVDPAWIVFNIIHQKKWIIAEHRYGAFITQLFPLIVSYLGGSIKSILWIYSTSFYLFYLSVAWIVGRVLRQEWLAMILAIYLTLFVSDVFYWPNNEVHQGIAWMLLFIGLYLRIYERPSLILICISGIAAFLAVSSHLLVAIPLLFLWSLIHIHKRFKNSFNHKIFWCFTGFILLLILIRYYLSNAGWYDPIKLQGVKEMSVQSISKSFRSGQSQTFLQSLIHNYWISILVFLLSNYFLLKSRRYFSFMLLWGFSLAYYVLICITFPEAYDRNLRFYMESEWAALSIIIAAPMVIYLRKNLNTKLIFIIILSIRCIYILSSYTFFHQRFNELSNMLVRMEEKGITKAIIEEHEEIGQDYFIMTWGLPIESWLLSEMNPQLTSMTFKLINEEEHISLGTDSFYSCFGVESIQHLNLRYFNLDTVQQYMYFKSLEEFFKSPPP